MIVECVTLAEFCQELEREALAGGIKEAVRVRIEKHPEQEERLTWLVGVWCTALIQKQNAVYILEAGLVCNAHDDFGGDPPNMAGSNEANEMREQVRKVCEAHGLILAGGKWE